jgi:DNA mismatch repair protein MutH
MQAIAEQTVEVQTQRWTLNVVPERPCRLRHGQPLRGTTNTVALVERVSGTARIDAVMRHQLVRILTVTVEDWIRH